MIKKLFFPLVLTLSMPLMAQTVDPTFGTNGTQIYSALGSYYDAKVLSDGKLILPGTDLQDDDYRAVLVKFNPDGNLDNSFNGTGKVIINASTSPEVYEEFFDAHILTDGKILVIYYSEDENAGSESTKLMRFNPNGTIDNTFNSPASNASDYFESFEVLADGKILAVGNGKFQRFLPNGARDTTYGTNGIRNVNFELYEIYINSGGIFFMDFLGNRMVKMANENATTYSYYNVENLSNVEPHGNSLFIQTYGTEPKIIKLNSNLQQDASFATNGILTLTNDPYYGINAIMPNGSILSVTNLYNEDYTETTAVVRRINYDGTIDALFGTDGAFNQVYTGHFYSYGFYHPIQDKFYIWSEEDNTYNIVSTRLNLPAERLAVDHSSLKNQVKIVQNPVRETLKLSSEVKEATIYDASGRKTQINFSGTEVSVSPLKAGIYHLSAKDKDGQEVKLKFIKR